MAVDKKTAGTKACEEAERSPVEGEGKKVRTKAPDQDVLPGILGKQLRAAYGELLNAPIPDAFAELIKQLEGREPGSASDGPGKPASRSEDGDK